MNFKDYAYLFKRINDFDVQEFSVNMISLISVLLIAVPTLGEKYTTDYPTTYYPTPATTTLNPCPYSHIGPTTKATNAA